MASCKECYRTAEELWDADDLMQICGMTPEEYARDDGTYNRTTDLFWCDDCYIKLGMPLGTA